MTRGACRASGAGPREQRGRLRAARGGAAGRPRTPGGRRGAGLAPGLAPQRRGPRRRQLLARHAPPAPRARLVSTQYTTFSSSPAHSVDLSNTSACSDSSVEAFHRPPGSRRVPFAGT
jgi:hypothetical protein